MSTTGTVVGSGAITVLSDVDSHINADDGLIQYFEEPDVDYDLKIDILGNWNSVFKECALPGPTADDTDASGNNDTTGENYLTYSNYETFGSSKFSGTNVKLPRDALELVIEGADGTQPNSADFPDIKWSTAKDDNSANDIDGSYRTHMQSVAKGLVGLFSQNENLSGGSLQLEDDPDNSADSSGGINPANADREIRIDQDALLAFMGPDGEYGQNVFTTAQIQQLMEAASDLGRYHQEDASDATLDRDAALAGHRVLALRNNDMLQIKATVYDKTGDIGANDSPNKRHWLIGLKQSVTGAYTLGAGYE
jgi:hypothetical protein